MQLSSQWFVAQGVSAVRHGVASAWAFAAARRANAGNDRRTSKRRRLPQGFSIAVPADGCLAIDDAAGCTAEVLEGQVWITVDGSAGDTIANAGSVVALPAGGRILVSAFADATLLIAVPSRAGRVAFALRDATADATRLLSIAADRGDGASGAVERALDAVAGAMREACLRLALAFR